MSKFLYGNVYVFLLYAVPMIYTETSIHTSFFLHCIITFMCIQNIKNYNICITHNRIKICIHTPILPSYTYMYNLLRFKTTWYSRRVLLLIFLPDAEESGHFPSWNIRPKQSLPREVYLCKYIHIYLKDICCIFSWLLTLLSLFRFIIVYNARI